MAKSKLINLLPQEEFESSITGRVLKWAMGTFRIIVIITEMVVMAAFLSRFWLDAQNSDLSNSIKTLSAAITAQSDFEKQFRATQEKLSIVKALNSDSPPSQKIDYVAGSTPKDITLSAVNVGPKEVDIKGTAGSEVSIAQFMINLKSNSTFKNVDLGGVGSSQSNPTMSDFIIKITY